MASCAAALPSAGPHTPSLPSSPAGSSAGSSASFPDELCEWLLATPPPPAHAAPPHIPADVGPPPFAPLPSDLAVGESGWLPAAAASLRHNGFCILRHPPRAPPRVDPQLCAACARAASRQLLHLLAAARGVGLAPRRELFRFAEICSRAAGGLRYDMRLPLRLEGAAAEPVLARACAEASGAEGEAWDALHAAVDGVARGVVLASGLLAVEGRGEEGVCALDSAGCVTSLPGAPDQHFHPDGTAEGLVNAFVALVPTTVLNGPTELRPGSHVWVESALGPEPRWDERTSTTVAELAVGEILLFDYRTYHRGRANRSDEPRPVAYLVYARPGVSDQHNFPAESLLTALANGADYSVVDSTATD
ncbi:hypothetical protein AB1Y20_007573 [Prymnesium parvum]|uniref:Uncharacterized protein n=1 Tax=Prymnesium parvum TaxID=97485 RepID=A0AB34IXD2_PRYPA